MEIKEMSDQLNLTTEKVGKPILVQNPYTNKVVNMEPFFKVIETDFDGSFEVAASEINSIIRRISCFPLNSNPLSDGAPDNSTLLWRLYSFHDMVSGIEEVDC